MENEKIMNSIDELCFFFSFAKKKKRGFCGVGVEEGREEIT